MTKSIIFVNSFGQRELRPQSSVLQYSFIQYNWLLMNDGRKRKAPKHQNKTAFKIQFDPLSLQVHKKVSFKGLCKRCADQISWKIKYNKYKKMTEPAKCTFCHQKNVSRTYMRACEPCMEAQNVCPKCLETETEEQIEVKLNELQQKKQDQEHERRMNEFLKTLKERSRRTVKRLHEKDAITWNNDLQQFVDLEGNVLPVQFRQGYGPNKDAQGSAGASQDRLSDGASQDGSEDQFGSDLDQDSEEEEEKKQQNKNKTNNKNNSKEAEKDKNEIKADLETKVTKIEEQKKQIVSQKQGKKEQKVKSQDQSQQECQDEEENSINSQEQQEQEDQGDKQEGTQIKQGEQGDWEDVEEENQESTQKDQVGVEKQEPKK